MGNMFLIRPMEASHSSASGVPSLCG
ncbi:hypothetical protein PSHT_02554 [Puccinia striiformis]|uniref:Uncharacterized protein n=2 Tax=Puccinia striiformis TaxID=27350 RepID=A0A2S4WHR4_9BASI|nr:hypothetical protein PSTT_03377 [Puccinia striiformis]POW21291.1 hypothetical protein PSHT_02554 [Puccinia striiformis]